MSQYYKTLTRRTQPESVPIFPLNGTVLLPGCDLPLNIFEPRYLNMVDDALKTDRLIGMVQSDESGIKSIGSLGRITQFSETEDARYLIVLRGLKRFEIVQEIAVTTPYRQAKIRFDAYRDDAEAHGPSTLPEAFITSAKEARSALTLAMKNFAHALGVEVDWDGLKEIPLPRLIDQAAMISPFNPDDKQSLLEALTSEERRQLLVGLMQIYTAAAQDQGGRSVQ